MDKYKKNRSFIKLDRDFINSPPWRNLSINGKRLIDFLWEEHLSKGGRENGKLKATYDQLVEVGIPRRLVHRTITETESFGLIRVERGGRRGCVNHISTYTVTFLPLYNGRWMNPPNDWKKISQAEILSFQKIYKIKSRLRHETTTVSQSDNPQLHDTQSLK